MSAPVDISREACERLAEFFFDRASFGFVYGGTNCVDEWDVLVKTRAKEAVTTIRALRSELDKAEAKVDCCRASNTGYVAENDALRAALTAVERERDAYRSSEAEVLAENDALRFTLNNVRLNDATDAPKEHTQCK